MMTGHKAHPATTSLSRLSQRDSTPVELATGGLAMVLLFVSAAWLVLAASPRAGGATVLLLAVASTAAGLALVFSWLRLRTLRVAAAHDLAGLEKSEARLAGIIRSSMEAILSVDDRQRIVLFNPMAEILFGCPASHAIGRPLSDFIPERFRSAHEAHVRRFGVTGVSERQMGKQRALFALHADGREFPIEASISQIDDGGSKLFTVMLRDITERVRAEAALRRSQEELQHLSDSILAAREEERHRIARELHDDLGQRLSALKMDITLLAADIRAADGTSPFTAQTDAMQRVIDDTIAAVRQISADLRPPLLDELGLVPAIEWIAKAFRQRFGLIINVRAHEASMDERAAISVFRIVQEALNNVVRHADATRVEIAFAHSDGMFALSVQDNGRGWNGTPPTEGGRKPLGLLGIRERARLLGGQATVTQTPRGGFCLTVRFPDRHEAAQEVGQ
ncbi:PAS domain S-box protein [Ralstonia solanacearum P673]|uniref:PAS domain-containing sensor histidine kinase n=1 Tax=Ralstonia solanacearum TaxID=305 RepID=UPI0004507C9A|nr:PAS domain-containing sensor histidine kinase [Ralstonia solanacearum]EUJ15063.1 histidine kinase [Ralstonia solanacearum P673]MCL9848150.1 PAS domain-containing sensor histidine kinase [Ralstonia solanacearum]MCL9854572.1 PAS domain-containing sensor histidine kinase [Ralstonia solanacearum]MCL9859884.1 PAS domain-containing sensor histidine kinase [Ralstonia solanacearum]MCL9864317.1 PAS domain-containing sensor histidine kinase [Ralstonia solanacearum]